MATEVPDNDMKKGMGYLKEKFVIGMTRFTDDEVERAIMKVTSHMLKAPNEKHMQRLIAATHGNYNCGKQDHGDINRYIIVELEKRSHTHNWVVVLKSMVAFHRLMTDGSVEVNRLIQLNRNCFCLRHVKDLADSPDGAAQQSFIEQYIRYLEERSIAQQALGLSARLESEAFSNAISALDLPALTRAFAVLLQQMEAVAAVEFRPTIVDNFCTLEAYRKLVVDAKRLFAILMGRMVWLLEQFEDLPLPLKQTWLKLFIRFHKCSKLVAAFMVQIDSANIHFGEAIPRLKVFPDTLQRRLEDDVDASSVQKEDLSALLGPQVVAELRLEPPPTAASAGNNAVNERVTTPPAKVSPRLTTNPAVAAPAVQPAASSAKPADPLADIFGPPVPQTATAPPPSTSNRAPSAAAASSGAPPLWGTADPPAQPARYSPVDSRAAVSAPPSGSFDPFTFAPAPVVTPPPSATSQAAPLDFFSSGPRAQQPPPQATPPAPFSDLAAQGKHRAW
jgi:hypothetical protein